jgi:hypothetical protein
MKQALVQAKRDTARSPYWRGYIHGLWRGHYGQDISPGDELGDDYSNGHGDGYFAGQMADVEKEAN